MINFCVEPEKHCHRNPIRELDLKVDRYYSSIYCRLCKHINNTVVHITQEERDEWNNKASKEALKDIQDQLNEITGDGSNSIKQEILLEVTKQIAEAIADLNLGEYAKKKYVDDAIKNINLDGYVTKDYADSTYLKIANYTKFDADSYYTKAEIQNMLKNSDIAKDYSISEFTIEDNNLILVQKNGGRFEIALSDSGAGNGVDISYIQDQLKNYIKKGTLSRLIINGKSFSIEKGSDIEIPVGGGGSNVDPTKYGYYKSYFKETSSKGQTPSKPIANRPPEDGSGWVENAPNYRDGYYIWMTQVFINGNGQYGEYLNPICLTGSGTAGEDGSGVSFIYKTAIEGEEINSPGNVSVENGVPVVPSGWTDHPSGVTKDVPYEYCSVVISTKGQWGSYWSQPFVWSHFGQNGMDGDGVEYIYYASTFAPSNNLPSIWTDDEDFQNREYIRENSGWTDDPQDLEELGAGYKQYVCVRKKYADTDGQAAYWHAYSDPALWGYYARNGVVNGVSYSLQLSGLQLTYKPLDGAYSFHIIGNVELYRIEAGGSSTKISDSDANVKYQLGSDSSKTDLTYQSDSWNLDISKTLQSSSDIVTLYAYNTNGAYLTSMSIPLSASGEKGDKGDTGEGSVGQALKGSPLRIRGDFDNSQTYYDGKRAVSDADGVMYQDIVRYNNMYYACVNYDTWESEKGTTQNPETSTAFESFRISDNAFYDLLIANKANIREISSEEVVIFEGDGNSQGDIVAGITSGKDVDSNSELNGRVDNKGDVRIWAGKMQTNGDLTTAYTTIDSNGSIVMQNIQQGKSIKFNPQECSFKIIGPFSVTDDSYTDGTYIPSSDERVELANFEYYIDPDSLSSAIKLIMQSYGKIIIDPADREISIYNTKDDTYGQNCSIITDQSIRLYDDSGYPYISIMGHDSAGSDFAALTNSYNHKGLHLKRIRNATSNDILYILDGLPTSDPKMEGVLWMDTDRTLKVSSRGFGS